MLEKDIEKYFRNAVEETGGLCWKFTSPGRRGVPDRICILPNGRVFFAELKRPDAKARPDEKLQKAMHEELAARGLKTYVLKTRQDVDLLRRFIDAGILPEAKHFARL